MPDDLKERFSFLLIFTSLSCFPLLATAKELPGKDIFDAPDVIRIRIDVPPGGVRILNGQHWRSDERPAALATVSDGRKTYTNVAVHLKGSAGSYRYFDSKPALTLNFDKNVPGQTFHGLHKFSLNNSVQDSSFVCEKVCRELMNAAGVPTPRADYAVVTLNGRNMGLYVLVEAYNKQFLKRHFKNVNGNLYDGGFCQDISGNLLVNSGEKPDDHTALRKLISATAAARQKNSLDDLSKILDLDRFISMVILEVITCHWDGYALKPNNWRLYHDLDTGRMVFMPHGMDQMFGHGGRGYVDRAILPYMNGFVANSVLSTADGRARYFKRFSEIVPNVFNAQRLTNRIMQITERINPVIAAERSDSIASNHRAQIEYLCSNILERGQFLDRELSAPSRALKFENGVARLDGWKPQNSYNLLRFDVSTNQLGKKILHLAADQPGAASFKTTVLLKNGRYRFEGDVRTQASDGTFASLRVTGAQAAQRITGDTDWTRASFLFDVQDPATEVDLLCELRGSKGEAWFDASSLRLREVNPPRPETIAP